MEYRDIIKRLYELENKEKVLYKEKKFGIYTQKALGIYQSDLNKIARQIGKNSTLAIKLFESNIYEAKILCAKTFHPKDLTEELLEKWVLTFDNWEVCDSFSMGLIAKSSYAQIKIEEWTRREEEFVKRAGFATMAAYCMADKKAENSVYEDFFSIIIRESKDERLYVKKAVNWALRSIGKRNIDLNKKAIKVAKQIEQFNSKTAKWIAKDAIKELSGEKVKVLDYPRAIYRPNHK